MHDEHGGSDGTGGDGHLTTLPPAYRRVWEVLLDRANVKPTTVLVGSLPVRVPRGGALIAERTLAERAGVSRRAVLSALKLLARMGEIAFTVHGHVRVVTLTHYEERRSHMVKGPGAIHGRTKGDPEAIQGRSDHNHEGGRKEEDGTSNEQRTLLVEEVALDVVAEIPTKSGQPYRVTQRAVDQWKAGFPGVDVKAEVVKAGLWCEANPRKRKTYDGMLRFLVGWLGRAGKKAPAPAASRSKGEFMGMDAEGRALWRS